VLDRAEALRAKRPRCPRPTRLPHPIPLPRPLRRPRHQPEGLALQAGRRTRLEILGRSFRFKPKERALHRNRSTRRATPEHRRRRAP
jgi:hypothetical protein